MEGSDTRRVTARSLKHPCTQDPSKIIIKTHTHPRGSGIPERDPQTHANGTHDTDLGHQPETQAHVCTHTIPQMDHNCWTSLERQTQDPIHTPGTFPKTELDHRPTQAQIHTHYAMSPHGRPRHSHGQLQGQSPREAQPLRTTPCKPDPRKALPLTCSGT